MNAARARVGAALLIALCLGGCPHRPGPGGPLQRFEDAPALLEAVRQQAQKLERLRVRGTVLARREGQRVKARFAAATALPARLRFETESFFDQPVSILVTDGMEFSLWDMEGGRFFVGRATPANLSRAIPVFLDGPEVVGLLRGEPPLIAFAESRLELEPDGAHYLVWLSNSRERERLRIDGRELKLLEVEVEVEGRRLYLLKLAAWEDRPRLPREISFEMPSQKLELTLKVRQAEAAEPFAEDVFRLAAPPGVPVENLDAP
ncbi:MAG: hypothetical protein GYA21_04105 [Myxococcales bacterium]|nr:hypothetical protein [Myxococcales bacterium]